MAELVLRVSAKALIVNDEGEVLILRESASHNEGTSAGKYLLPGGRLEAGEAFYDGLAREVMEETGLRVEAQGALYVGEWRPVIRGILHQIIAMFVICRAKSKDVSLSEEHDGSAWIRPNEYINYDFEEPEDKVIQTYLDTRRDKI